MRNLTVLALAITFALQSMASAQWGNLKGKFVLDGDAPKAPALTVTKDIETCGKCKLIQESLVVNSANGGIKNVVIFLYPDSKQKRKLKVHSDYDATAKDTISISNKCCRFEPRILALRTTQTLDILNPDPVAHNSKVSPFKNPQINPNIPAGSKVTAKFPKEETYPTEVACSIHPWMKGYLIIKDHPYVGISDGNGAFEIKNLPEGKWRFRVWQERSGNIEQVNVGGKKTKWSKGRVELTIKGDTDLGDIKIAAAEFDG